MLRQHQEWIEDVVIRLLCVFALDRFGDFVSDEVGFLFLALQLNRTSEDAKSCCLFYSSDPCKIRHAV